MIKNYLKTSIRSLLRQKGTTAINIVGLTLGLTCSMLILLWIGNEISFDRTHKDGDRIYRMLFNIQYPNGTINTWRNAPQPLEEVLEKEYPEIEHAMLISWNGDRLLTLGDQNFKKSGVFASEDIFEIFDTPFIVGKKETALKEKNSIVITEKLAQILFGDNWRQEEILGAAIMLEKEDLLTITGIVPNSPSNSSIQFDYVIPFKFGLEKQPWNRQWGNFNNRMFVKLKEGVEVNAFNEKVEDVVKTHRKNGEGDDTHAFVYPIEDLYLYGNFENGINTGGRIEYIQIFGAVSIFVLLLACINFMNMATARSFRRAKEVGIRKVVGANKRSLIFQFIGESILITLFSLLLAVGLSLLLLPVFNELMNQSLSIDFQNLNYWVFGIVFLVITSLLAGLYPAFFISGFKPASVLKGNLATSHNAGFFRKSLVVFQFFLSMIMIISTFVVQMQIDFIMNRNLGLDKENVMLYGLNNESYPHFQAIKNELLQHSEIVSVTTCNQNPLNVGSSASGMEWEGKKEGEEIEFSHLWVTYDFIETLGMELLDGRDFSPEYGTDSSAFLVNEAAIKAMGLENPVGSAFNGFWIEEGKIIGVIKDFHSASIYNPIDPLIVIMDEEPYQLYIRTASEKTGDAIQLLENIHDKYTQSYPFEYHFMNENYDQIYKSEMVMSKLSNFFAVLAILISCLGLIGLASLTTSQRVKEIGIRKVMGATIANILFLLSKDYFKLIVISFVISAPVAYYFISAWLEKFAFRIEVHWWIYPVAGLLVIIVALLSVGSLSVKAAATNPVDSLRDE